MAPPGDKSAWTALAELSSIGFAMVLATVIGLVGGYYADKWLGTKPWLLLIGLGLLLTTGTYGHLTSYLARLTPSVSGL